MKFLLGTKVGMTQIFKGESVVPVTLIEAGPVVVTQIKEKNKDGYEAVQVGFGHKKKISKPILGHLKGSGNFRWLREHRTSEASKCTVGDKVDVSVFNEGDIVKLVGTSKGKGFQGVVKRHGFHGMPKSHGTKEKYRAPGAIGSRFPQHVRKGKRMAGRMGQDRVTIKKVKIIKIDKENNFIAIKGSVPGSRGSLIEISA